MKLTLEKSDLVNIAGVLRPALGGGKALPILNSVLIQIAAEGVRFTATNLDQRISTVCPPGGSELLAGTCALAVPSKQFFEIVRQLPNLSAELEFDPGRKLLKIRSGISSFTLNCQDAHEFPPAPSRMTVHRYEFNSKELRTAVESVAHAVSTDAGRLALNAICFEIAGAMLTAVATDGRRMAFSWRPLENWAGGDQRFLVPREAVSMFVQMAAGDRPVTVSWNDNLLEVEAGSTVFTTKLLDAPYPGWRAVVPSEDGPQHRVELERDVLERAVRLAEIMTTEKQHSVRVTIGAGQLKVESPETDLGYGRKEEAIAYPGDRVTLCFHPGFLRDALETQKEHASLRFRYSDPTLPLVLESDRWKAVIMPMRLQ